MAAMRKSFQFYVDGRGITAAARRKALLLHCAGMEVQEIFETLTNTVMRKFAVAQSFLHFSESSSRKANSSLFSVNN